MGLIGTIMEVLSYIQLTATIQQRGNFLFFVQKKAGSGYRKKLPTLTPTDTPSTSSKTAGLT